LIQPFVFKPSGTTGYEAKGIQPYPTYHKTEPFRLPRLGHEAFASLRYRTARQSPSLVPLTSWQTYAVAEK